MDVFMAVKQTETRQMSIRVLVVDDEEKLGRFVCMLLERMGYQASLCLSVDEAKRLLAQETWHLVISDIVLPGENGFDLIQWLKHHYPNIPVVAMTAHSTEAANHRIRKLGFVAVLHKPFSVDQFQRVVQQVGLPIEPLPINDTFF
ncbi:MAG: response regulator [Caldilineaceae bacterium]|nr:response regulator [Caldilineaceae bacterium]